MVRLLFSPYGRISATGFFSGIAVTMLAMIFIGFGLGTLPAVNGPIILSICWILLAWPMTCLLIRRLHDTGRSAVWLWLLAPQVAMALLSLAMGGFMPAIVLWLMTLLGVFANLSCWSLLFYLALQSGDEGENTYGPAPHPRRGGIAAETA